MPLFKPLFVSTSYVHDSSVDRFSVKGVQFVSVNSMAMEGDGCFLCRDAEARLIKVQYKCDVCKSSEFWTPCTLAMYGYLPT